MLRLLADDLTGALDTAAELVGLVGPVPAFWHGGVPAALPASAAIDSGTRELPAPQAVAVAAHLAAHLTGGADDGPVGGIAYKKIDSLLRGPTLAELAACVRAGGWDRCVLAPAFPYQGRATRDGRQFARAADGGWTPAGGNIVAALRAEGAAAQPGRLGAELPPGISVFDAESDEDLRAVAATGRRWPGRVLWSGTGGLAQALAAGTDASVAGPLPRPVLGLFGSDQPATAAQLAACGAWGMALPDGGPGSAEGVARRLRREGVALVSLDLPPGLARADAAARIGRELGELARRLPVPGTLVAAGGETLRGLCLALGAASLEVRGRAVPGVPVSILRGGRWDGVTVLSKSGAFGSRTLLRDLLGGPPARPAPTYDFERTA